MEEKVPNLKLRNARTRNNWKQQDVADRIVTTPLSVGRWERGEAFPSAYYRQQLCDLFGMSPEELGFTEEEEPLSQSFDKTDTETHEADKETHQRIADDTTLPVQRKEKRNRLFILVGIVLALIVTSGVITYVMYLAHPSAIKPGGGWISPIGKTVKRSIYFAAYAYPTHEGEPAIDHVNFTVYWQGADPRKWVIACVSRRPFKKDIFSCTADLHALGVPAGEVTISFDVYDRQGNHNNSPTGPHTVTYSP
ncbi:MAG TPA: helix-turn-helix transcriptional regulator [Ktedonobacteraceae bacterium]|nr:helix-turn-helix transcriptional regulator [Ktedonobacteraceae bacterium]